MKRKRVLGIVAVMVVVLMGLSGCQKSKDAVGNIASPDYTLRVGYVKGLCHAPMHVAYEKGYFEKQGIHVQMVPLASANMADALASNQIDAGCGMVGKFVHPLENGLNMKITSGLHTGCMKLVVPANSSIKSVADLKGKKIGVVSLADSPCVTTKRSLADEGIGVTADHMEVEFVIYTAADLPVALQNGAIDAFADADPSVSIAQKSYGLKTIIDTAKDEKYAKEYCCATFVSTTLAEKNPDLAAKYTRAVQEASVWVENNSAETAKMQLEKKYVSGELAMNTELLDAYRYIPSAKGGYEALKKMVYDLQKIGILKKSTDADALIERSFAWVDGAM